MAKCSKCNKDGASVRLITIINGQKTELFLCELCAQEEQNLSTGEIFKTDASLLHQLQKEMEEMLKGHYVGDVKVNKDLLAGAVKDIQDALQQLALSPADAQALLPSKTCPKCGITWEDIRKTSKFGCPHDYELFAEDFAPTMKRLHLGGPRHIGKVPTHLNIPVSRQIEALEQELAAVVKEERYENAAELRDRIKELKERNENNEIK